MPIKSYKAEQIVTMLQQIEISVANGKTTPQVCRKAEVALNLPGSTNLLLTNEMEQSRQSASVPLRAHQTWEMWIGKACY